MSRSLLTFFVSGLLTIVGCNQKPTNLPPSSKEPPALSVDDVQRDMTTALETTVAYSQQSKEKLMETMKDQLALMDSNIEALRLKGEGLASDAKANWERKMTELEVKRKSATDKLTEIENSTAEAWSDVEKGAQATWEDLKKAFQDASKEF